MSGERDRSHRPADRTIETGVTAASTATSGEPADSVDGNEDRGSKPDRGQPTGGQPSGGQLASDRPSGRDLARSALADAQAMAARRRGDQATGIHPRVQRRRRRNLEANTARRSWSGSGADERDPQPLGALMQTLFAERGWKRPVTEASVFTDWTRLVGADLAEHCEPTALHDGELKLTAQSSAWATQIRLLAPKVLARLADELGANVVTRLTVTGPTGPSWKHGLRSVPGARGPRDTYG